MRVNLLKLLFFSISITFAESRKRSRLFNVEFVGEKGDKGELGLPGLCETPCQIKGEKGYMGENGWIGLTGRKGRPGQRGFEGVPGKIGEPGRPGRMGILGSFGPKGFKGDLVIGPPGRKGEKGSIGLPGSPGVCSCPINVSENPVDPDAEFGTEANPATVTCKHASSDIESGYYYFNRKEAFKAKCDMTAKTTCLFPKTETFENLKSPTDYTNKDKEFWLSELESINIEDMYGVSISNIEWLQEHSDSVFLTLRYHCKNSYPYQRQDSSKALKLLTWNDVVIAPYSTSSSPIHYNISAEKDGCQNSAGSVWNETDITLTTQFVDTVPIKDFFISDIREGEPQSFYVELVSLCFG